MASKVDEGGCVALTWEIQNFSLFLSLKEGTLFATPFWKTEHTGKSVWRRLGLYVRASDIVFRIYPATESLHYDRCEVSLISSCGEVPIKFRREISNSWSTAIEREAVLGEKRQSIISNDTLTLRCMMWEKTIRTREFRFNSALHRFNYLWSIENFHAAFSYSEYIEEENFLFKVSLESKSEKGTHKLGLGEVSSKECEVLPINCKLSDKTDRVRVVEENFWGRYRNRMYEIKVDLNNTRLDLQLESVFAVHKELPSPPRYENVSEAASSELGDDLLLLYRDKLFSDATLNTEGKSFYVHKSILSARSPVFRAMFEKDEMSEGQSGVVDIDDVDSDTLDRMLVYLYGDSLESVQQWEEASALYYVADKYDIQLLKQKCANSLKEGLSKDNACEALVLADRHLDDQLMECVMDFIGKNMEVISSKKWNSLQNSNPLLAAKILREICMKIGKN